MAAALHIPESEVSDVKSLLDMASHGAVIVERDGVSYQVVRQPGRTAAEILADPTIPWSDVTLDDEFGQDLEAIRSENRKTDRDPWQE
jgi:hypothetical protein